jgi:hypothetical protein
MSAADIWSKRVSRVSLDLRPKKDTAHDIGQIFTPQ